MINVGFIDYYLNEWHADHLPTWLKEETNGEIIASYAYGKIDSPVKGAQTNKDWAEAHGIKLLNTIDEVIDKSDVLLVLSPGSPEMHEELCDKPLKSGKITYVDKTFAPDTDSAIRMIEKAKAHHTPMFTSSALRFSTEIQQVNRKNIQVVNMRGPGPFNSYSIHQIESIVCLMGSEAERVMFIGTEKTPGMVIQFSGNRWATMQHFDWGCPFNLAINYSDDKNSVLINECTDFFPNFVTQLVDFFKTGDIKAPTDETLAVTAIRQYGFIAKETPGVWVDLSRP